MTIQSKYHRAQTFQNFFLGRWSRNDNNPAAGKAVWLTIEDTTMHPIFFDDNIHNHPRDSIVAVRVRPDASAAYAALSGMPALFPLYFRSLCL